MIPIEYGSIRKYFNMKINNTIYLLALLSFCVGCESEREVRMYQEMIVQVAEAQSQSTQDPRMTALLQQSVAQVPLVWDLPQGWSEEAGSGMRLATLKSGDDSVVCSVTALAGNSGTLEQNVTRWLGQVGINLSPTELQNYLQSIATKRNTYDLPMQVVDFVSLLSEPTADNMITAIIEYENSRIFLKLTGTTENLLKHQSAFQALLQSIRIRS